MSIEEDDMEIRSWRGEWQGLGETAWTERLEERVVRDGRALQRHRIAQVLAALFSTTIVTVLAWRMHRPETWSLAAIVWVFNVVTLTRSAQERARTLRAEGSGTEAFVALTQTRLRTALVSARSARRTTWGLAAALAPACAWVFVQNADRYRSHPWSAVFGFGTIAVTLAIVLATSPRREAQRAAALDAFLRELEDARGAAS